MTVYDDDSGFRCRSLTDKEIKERKLDPSFSYRVIETPDWVHDQIFWDGIMN